MKVHRLLAACLGASSLTGCGSQVEPKMSSDVGERAPQLAEARKTTADGLRCMDLLGAIAEARHGPLRELIEQAGLSGIEPEFAERWKEQVVRDGISGGLSAESVRRMVANEVVLVLDEDEIRASAREAHECAAEVSGPPRG